MSQLFEKINGDLIEAMKAKDEVSVSTLRLLVSAIKNKQIDLGHELNDEEVLEVVSKAAKQRRESIEAYKKGGRDDLSQKEEAELVVIEKYLPKQLEKEEISKIVDDVILETGASGQADFGKVIGEVMKKVKGQADGSVVSGIVREKLS